MFRTTSGLALRCSVLILISQLASASVIPGRWEKVEALVAGAQIWVILFSGERLQGSLTAADADRILMLELGGQSRDLPKTAIKKIVQIGERHTDPVWNGLAIGAATGVGSYLLGHGILCCAPNLAHDIAGAAFLAAIGMGIGALADATATSDEQVVHRAR